MTEVAPENADQARAWDGPDGAHWAADPDPYDAALRHYRPVFNAAAAVTPTDVVLDVGCGNGQSTRDAARAAAAGSALGVDLSSQMILRATRIAAAEGVANVRFTRCDAQIHPFAPASFDAVISRTGAMFFGNPAAAFANLARALRPDGRLVLLTWQGADRNEWITTIRATLAAGRDVPAPPPGAPGPFGLSDPATVCPVLTGAGFTDVRFEAVDRPYHVGVDVAAATAFATGTAFAKWLLSGLDEGARGAACARLRDVLASRATADGVQLGSNCWLISARRSID